MIYNSRIKFSSTHIYNRTIQTSIGSGTSASVSVSEKQSELCASWLRWAYRVENNGKSHGQRLVGPYRDSGNAPTW